MVLYTISYFFIRRHVIERLLLIKQMYYRVDIFAARNHGSGMVKSNIQGKSKDFDESVFLKLDVTYTESGAPIVDDINASV